MKKQPFKLPKLSSFEVDTIEKKLWFDKIRNAKKIITFIKTSDSDCECLFSGMGVEELGMILISFDKDPELYDLFYSAVVNINSCDVDPPFLSVDPPEKRAINVRA